MAIKSIRNAKDILTAKDKLLVWMEEYKILSADIIKRIELQQRNFGVHTVFMSAIAAYLFNYGMANGFKLLLTSEALLLIIVSPIISILFLLRHIDHDSEIVDKAQYIQVRTKPEIIRLSGELNMLGFESFLADTRRKRYATFGALSNFGNEHTILLFCTFVYVAIGMYILVTEKFYGGVFHYAVLVLVPVCAALFCWVSIMTTRAVNRYRSIDSNVVTR